MLKRNLILVVVLLLVLLIPVLGLSHSGGTDGKGGHYDRSTGEYHYHHGYSAHQHPFGYCEYEHDEDSYYEGYNNGHDDGYDEGYDKGYTVGEYHGYKNGQADGYEEAKPIVPKWCFYVFAAAALTIFILSLVCRSNRKKAQAAEEELQWVQEGHPRRQCKLL